MSRPRKIALSGSILFGAWIFLAPFLPELLIVEKPLAKADVIWVLGGSSEYLERTAVAAQAFHTGIAAKIFVVNDGVFGGWNQTEQRNLPFYELSRRELVRLGVPTEAVEIVPTPVDGTYSEAELFAELARQRDYRSVLLVTSTHHSRRTLWTFNRIFAKSDRAMEVGLETSKPTNPAPSRFFWWISRRGWETIGAEIVKNIGYWVYY